MSKLDATKEILAFLTKLFFVLVGIFIVVMSGLVTTLNNQSFTLVFWFGVLVAIGLVAGSMFLLRHILKCIQRLEKL